MITTSEVATIFAEISMAPTVVNNNVIFDRTTMNKMRVHSTTVCTIREFCSLAANLVLGMNCSMYRIFGKHYIW